MTNTNSYRLLEEMGITEEQHQKIMDVIHNYSNEYKNIWDSNKYGRYSFEGEMEEISDGFKQPQLAELLLKHLAEEENCENYKILFVRLYGHYQKYEGIYPEIL